MVLADVRIVGQVGVIRRQHRDMQALALGRLTNLYPAKAACPQADAVFNQRPVSFGAIQANDAFPFAARDASVLGAA